MGRYFLIFLILLLSSLLESVFIKIPIVFICIYLISLKSGQSESMVFSVIGGFLRDVLFYGTFGWSIIIFLMTAIIIGIYKKILPVNLLMTIVFFEAGIYFDGLISGRNLNLAGFLFSTIIFIISLKAIL